MAGASVDCARSAPPSTPPGTTDIHGRALPSPSAVAARRALAAAQRPAPSHPVAVIERGATGPFVARAGDASIAAWMASSQHGQGQDLVVVPLAHDGAALGRPEIVASSPQEATSFVIRPAGGPRLPGGPRGGWIAAWSNLLDRGEALTVLGLQRDGTARGTPVDVVRTSDHIEWCDVAATSLGAVVVWVEETSSGEANVLASALDGEGKPVGMPARVARGVDRWGIVSIEDGVGLTLVSKGRLSWLQLDAQAQPRGPAVAIGAVGTVDSDVDAVNAPGGVLFGWTDRNGQDAQVTLAWVDREGKVTGPVAAMDAVGGSSLIALASGPAGAALAWEEPSARGHAQRALHLASVALPTTPADRLSASPTSAIEIADGPRPELAAMSEGFAVLAPSAACRTAPAGTGCVGPVVPTFVRFDARLQPVQAEPMLVGADDAGAALGWGLGCNVDRCLALAATPDAPTSVYAMDFVPRASPFAVPVQKPLPPDAPRVTSLLTVASGQTYDDVAAARLGDTLLVAALASPLLAAGDEARSATRGSVLSLLALDQDGRPRLPTQTLTSRAVITGGIAVAPGGSAQDGAAVAWVTGEDSARQVHVAHVDPRGRRNNEIELTTRARGDVTSVALAWAGDGWLAAWVDGRDGNGEVYATKVDRDLVRVAREERITNAPGDASDVSLAVGGSNAWLAWSDPRESPREGLGDIYATTIGLHDAKRKGEEVRVLASAPHSRSPLLAPTPGGGAAVVAWIEDAATGLEGPGAAMAALLGPDGRVVQAPLVLPLSGDGRPTSIALEPTPGGVRAVIVRTGGSNVSFDALVLGADGAPVTKPWPLLDVEAPASFDVQVALAGDALVFDDVGKSPGDHHVRRASIVWRR